MTAFHDLLRAELHRFYALRTLLWAPTLVVVASAAPVLMFGLALGDAVRYCSANGCAMPPTPDVDVVLTGLSGTGSPAVGVVAALLCGAMFVLSDLRHRVLTVAVLLNPHRLSVLGVRALLAFTAGSVGAGAGVWLGAVLFVATGESAAVHVDVLSGEVLGLVLRSFLAGGLLAIVGLTVAFLVLRTIFVVAILVLWPLLVEPMFPSLFGQAAEALAHALPVVNAKAWTGSFPAFDFTFTASAALAIFMSWVILLFGAAWLRFERLRLDSRLD